MKPQIGLFLINLGTPDAPTTTAVRRYLKEFLSDPEVITLPAVLRWMLLQFVILPFRSKKSALLYQKIWTQNGSPLLINSQKLSDALKNKFSSRVTVALGMRYGNPSLKAAWRELSHCDKIIVLPLFPQYATATTRSVIRAVESLAHKESKKLIIIKEFFQEVAYIESLAAIIREKCAEFQSDFLLMSYHGLPLRQLDKAVCQSVNCDQQMSCSTSTSCYRAQCYATSHLLAKALDLGSSQYTVSFQSRLGKIPWIKPYTDEALKYLRKNNVKRLAVVVPSFVSDCLETLEEIGIRAKKQWMAEGGEDFLLIPALNDNAIWIEKLSKMIEGYV